MEQYLHRLQNNVDVADFGLWGSPQAIHLLKLPLEFHHKQPCINGETQHATVQFTVTCKAYCFVILDNAIGPWRVHVCICSRHSRDDDLYDVLKLHVA